MEKTYKLSELMTKKIHVLSVNANAKQAYALMQEKRIRHIPLIDEDLNIVGILSARDLNAQCVEKSLPLEFIMSSPVEHVDQDTPLKTVVHRMLEKKVSSLLITDEKEDVVGIITSDDLLGLLSEYLEQQESSGLQLNLGSIGQIAQRLADMGI